MAFPVYVKVAEAAAADDAWDAEGGAAYFAWVRVSEGQLSMCHRAHTAHALSHIFLRARHAFTTAPRFSVSDFAVLCTLYTVRGGS